MRLVKGMIRVKFDEADYPLLIDSSYRPKEMLSISGTVTAVGDIFIPYEYRFGNEFLSYYNINEGVRVGDRVILRWVGVSGCVFEDGEATISYDHVIAVEGIGGLVMKNRFLMLDNNNQVIGISTDSDIPVRLGEYVFPRYAFRLEYMYDDRWFTDDKDVIAVAERQIDREWIII